MLHSYTNRYCSVRAAITMNLSCIFIVILLRGTFSALLTVDKETNIILQLKLYLNNILRCRNDREVVAVYDKAENIINWFLTQTNATVRLANKTGLSSVAEQMNTEAGLYLFDTFKEQVFEYIYTIHSSYTYPSAYFIIICTPNNQSDTENFLVDIWTIFNCLDAFLITCKDSVQITTYNPFLKRIVTFKEHQIKSCEMFSNKVKNLNGYKLNICLFEDPPRTIMYNGELDGKNIRTMKLVLEKINATAVVVIPQKINGSYFGGTSVDIKTGRCDLSFMEHFTTKVVGNYSLFCYPHRMDDFVVVVRQSSKWINYFSVYEIFDITTWLCILFGVLFTTVFRTCIDKQSDIGKSFINAWSGLTAVPLDAIFKASKKVKLVFIVWISGCLVLNLIFASLLASKMIKPKVTSNIDTIEELKEVNPKILISVAFKDSVPREYGISDNLVSASHLERKEALESLDDRTAVVIASSVIEMIRDRIDVHVLKEHLLPGFAVHIFKPKSPFRKIIDEIIFKDVEHGITNFNKNFTIKAKQGDEEDGKVQLLLKFVHIRSVFLILAIGYTTAAVAFVFEVLGKITFNRFAKRY